LKKTDGARIVLVSSFSVYGYLHAKSNTVFDENSPLEDVIDARDDYAHTKLIQERLVRSYAFENGWPLVVLRPGVIYGPGRMFGARLGIELSKRVWLRIASRAHIPITYVENCAQAVVLAAEKYEASGETYNILDDDPPRQRAYVAYIRRLTVPRPWVIAVPWTVFRCLARTTWAVNRYLLGGRAKLPGLLVPARLHARFKPLRYTNRHIRKSLGWTPRYTFEQAIDRCFGASGRNGAMAAPPAQRRDDAS